MKYVVNTKDAQGYLNWEYGMYKREKPRNRTASGGSKVKEYFS
jgi:hypothetical protein